MRASPFLPEPLSVPAWRPNAGSSEGYQVDDLVAPDGVIIARIEDFGYAAYPCAINVETKNLERGGAFRDRVQAKLWAERVAGLHPAKAGDERPPFYYTKGEKSE